tara:strand:- start:99 stop:434 length:336 start_codon:yes stop_codon:yes gene_type:complete
MSILNPTAVVQPTRIVQKVSNLLSSSKTQADKLIATWEKSFAQIWDDEDPAAVLAELGTNGAEVFLLSSATVQFLAAILASSRPDDLGRILAKVENMPAFDVNEDGTITLS